MNEEVVKVRELKLFQEGEILFSTSGFTIQKGERVAIKGDSGSGKSTLLHLLMGFFSNFEGEVELFGTALNRRNITNIRSRMGWVPQEFNFQERTMQDLFELPFSFKANKDKIPDQKEREEALRKFGLSSDLLGRSPDNISGGEKQRLFLTACFLLKKELVLLDEPTSALDPASRELVLNNFLSEQSHTLMVVAHDPEWVKRVDKVIEVTSDKELKVHG